MKTEVEKIYTNSRDQVEVRAWATTTFGDDWWYIELVQNGQYAICFNTLRTDPGPIHTIAALRWA